MSYNLKILVHLFILILNFKFIISIGPVEDNKILFYLSNGSTKKEQVSIGSYGNCTKSNLKVLVHGWLAVGVKGLLQTYWYEGIKESYMALGSNVVEVDWSAYNKEEYSYTAENIVPMIGNAIARFILGYTNSCGISLQNVQLLGHSLGAHAVGFAGKDVQKLTSGKKIRRITGLDPAGPWYKDQPDSKRLAKNDGTYVDTIIVDKYFLGINHSCGQVNFWINGGVPVYSIATHFFAPLVYQETILHPKYEGFKCQDNLKFEKGLCANNIKNTVGEKVDFCKPGDFYLHIPYSKVFANFIRNLNLKTG